MSNIVVYEPNIRRKTGLMSAWIVMFKNIIEAKDLIIQLFIRDFFATYKKSFLGIGWILIAPIIGIVSWVFMNKTGILNPGDVGIPYPAYVLLSSSIWGLFMGFYTSAAGTLESGSSFIMQVKYPHEALLVKQVAQQLANFIISFIFNIGVLLWFHVIPSWKIIFFPILIIPLFLSGTAIGLVISIFNVLTKEGQRAMDLILGLVIYITPVIYSSKMSNEMLQRVMAWNPLTYLVGGVRDFILYGYMDHWDRFIGSTIISVVFFLMSWRFFYISEEKIIEKMI